MEFWSPDFRTVGREMRRPPYYGLGAVFLEREERRRREKDRKRRIERKG